MARHICKPPRLERGEEKKNPWAIDWSLRPCKLIGIGGEGEPSYCPPPEVMGLVPAAPSGLGELPPADVKSISLPFSQEDKRLSPFPTW